jgi:hypothetical protein
MKRISFIVLFSGVLLAACGNESGKKDDKSLSGSLVSNPRSADGIDAGVLDKMPTMDFADTTHDFGSLHEGEASEYDFKFTNNGKSPLIIAKASGSCGCTVPEYPHEPIAPGQSGIMKVKFNSAGKIGHQNKSVTIMTNSNKGTHMLYINAEVIGDQKEHQAE